MRIQAEWIKRLGGLAITSVTRHWMGTMEYRWASYDPSVDPARDDFAGPSINLFWHEYIPALFYLRAHCRIAMLLSRHGDAEWLAHAARFMGFETVRGSTNRGGAQAIRELMTHTRRQMNLAITPDGPRGPRRVLAPGPIYVASRTGLPLVCIGIGYSRCWRLSTWDRFAIPHPGARVRGLTGPFLRIPPDLDRDGVEHYRREVERMLNTLTSTAEQWAETGGRMEGEEPARREPLHFDSPMRRERRSKSERNASQSDAPAGSDDLLPHPAQLGDREPGQAA